MRNFIIIIIIIINYYFEGTGKLEHIKIESEEIRTCQGLNPGPLAFQASFSYHWATQVHMVDWEQTRLVKIYHSHGRLKRPNSYEEFSCHVFEK